MAKPVKFIATADFSLLSTAFERTRAFMDDLEHIFNPEKAPDTPLPPLVGMGGPKEHGKDTFADYLVEDHGYIKTFMSEPLTAAVSLIGPRGPWVRLDFDLDIDWSHPERSPYTTWQRGQFMRYADLVEAVGYTKAKLHRDAREYLQGLGTEVGRNMLGENVWTDIAAEKIRQARAAGTPVVITGIRYQNEIELIRSLGGLTAWIERPALPAQQAPAVSHPLTEAIDEALELEKPAEDPTAAHTSETSLTAEDFDVFIDNAGSLDDLREQAAWFAREIIDPEVTE